MISHYASLLTWCLTHPAKILTRLSLETSSFILTNATRKKIHPKRQLYTITCWFYFFFFFYSICNCKGVSRTISIAGNNMIHYAVIRVSARWKEKICSLTWVTHRETHTRSKCHQAHCSDRALWENVHREFIIFICFHHSAIITPSKECLLTEAEKLES